VKTGRTIGHSRAQRFASAGGFIDHSGRRKDAGKEGVQRTAIIGVVRAGVRMHTALVTMAVRRMLGLMYVGKLGVRMMMISGRNGGPDGRVRLRQRRRNDAGELGGQKQHDQKPNRQRLSAKPLHGGIVGRPTPSVNPGRFVSAPRSARLDLDTIKSNRIKV
jgi:hypothetical protein